MGSIHQEIRIDASASSVYRALTDQAGYRGWWNARAEVPQKVGGTAHLHFDKDGQPVEMKFRIDETEANRVVCWVCTDHSMPAWVGTSLRWRLSEAGGATLATFEHGGWPDAPPEPVIQGWKHFLGSLKSYVETGQGQPW